MSRSNPRGVGAREPRAESKVPARGAPAGVGPELVRWGTVRLRGRPLTWCRGAFYGPCAATTWREPIEYGRLYAALESAAKIVCRKLYKVP